MSELSGISLEMYIGHSNLGVYFVLFTIIKICTDRFDRIDRFKICSDQLDTLDTLYLVPFTPSFLYCTCILLVSYLYCFT